MKGDYVRLIGTGEIARFRSSLVVVRRSTTFVGCARAKARRALGLAAKGLLFEPAVFFIQRRSTATRALAVARARSPSPKSHIACVWIVSMSLN